MGQIEQNIDKVKLSIVLATYNGENYIKKQLISLINQTFPIYEIIVVDDCSQDSTVQILQEFSEQYPIVKIFKNEINIHAIKSFQKAAALAEGEYIAFCDQDDIWLPEKLEKQMMLLQTHAIDDSRPLLLFHDLKVINEKDELISNSFWDLMNFKAYNFSFRSLLFKNVVTGCTSIINKKMKEIFVNTDPTKIMMHDHWFALIAFSFGNARYSDEKLIEYRTHSNSVTSKEKMTYVFKLRNLMNNLNRNKANYFVANIVQAKEFYRCFKDNLNIEDERIIKSVILLENKGLISKILRPEFRIKNVFFRKQKEIK